MTAAHDEEVPPLSAEGLAFLAHHAKTGEPTDQELDRGAARVAHFAPARRTPWLAWAAAAAVVSSAGVGLVVAMEPRLSAIADDSLPDARRTDDKTRPPAVPAPPTSTTPRWPGLSPLGARAAVDDPGEETRLLALARAAQQAQRFDEALTQLDACLAHAPRSPGCHQVRGAVLAALAARDPNPATRQRAHDALARALDLLPADDPLTDETLALLAKLPPSSSEVLVLRLNERRVVRFVGNVQRIAVGDPSTISVTRSSSLSSRALEVEGLARGRTSLVVWLERGGMESRLIEVR